MGWEKAKLKQVLKQYRIQHIVQDNIDYKQVTISKYDGVTFRGSKRGKDIGRKRQFIIDLQKYPNTLMLVRQGVQDGSIGLAPLEVDGCIATENMPMFSVEGIDVEYLKLILKSPYFYDELNKIKTTGSAQKSIHEREILEIEIPLPSFEAQKVFVKELTKLKNKGLKLGDELTNQLSLVKQLRQAFLSEAMQGKLAVAPSPSERTGGEATGQQLLERIKAEKAQLIKDKKLKKEKELPPIKPEEIPFEIPEDWVWCRLGEISKSANNGLYKHESYYKANGTISLRMYNIDNGEIKFEKLRRVELEESEIERYLLLENDILINRVNSLEMIGKSAVICRYDEKLVYESMNVRLRMVDPKIASYINQYLLIESSKVYFRQNAKIANGQVSINQSTIFNLLLPLPSLSIQNQIVAKLDELMKTCDDLENSIKQSQLQNEQLLQQVLREALEIKE